MEINNNSLPKPENIIIFPQFIASNNLSNMSLKLCEFYNTQYSYSSALCLLDLLLIIWHFLVFELQYVHIQQ